MNYTKPTSTTDDTPEDWLASALTFAAALGHLLKENEGVVVIPKNDLISLMPEGTTSLIVYSQNGQVKIDSSTESYPDGHLVYMEEEE